jgi:hypothetical protein
MNLKDIQETIPGEYGSRTTSKTVFDDNHGCFFSDFPIIRGCEIQTSAASSIIRSCRSVYEEPTECRHQAIECIS